MFKYFDYLNITPRLYIKGRTHYSSSFGILMGIFCFFSCIGFSIYFIYEYFRKTEGNIIFNEIVDFPKELNFTHFPFAFKLTNSKGISYEQNIVTFQIQHWIFPPNSKGIPIINTIPFQKCDFKKHLENNKYKKYYNEDFETYYCIDINNYELVLRGTFGDLLNGYSYLNLYISECKNHTTSDVNEKNPNYNINVTESNKNISSINNGSNFYGNSCLGNSEIGKQIYDSTLYLRISFIDFKIDHSDNNMPYKPYLRSDAILSTYKSKARVFYYYKHVQYMTDHGILGKEFIEETFYIFDNYHIEYPQVTYQVPEAFGLFSILISEKAFSFKRSFLKLQALIANIGGVLGGLKIIFEFIVRHISSKSIYLYLADNFLSSDPENFDINQKLHLPKLFQMKNFYNNNLHKYPNSNLDNHDVIQKQNNISSINVKEINSNFTQKENDDFENINSNVHNIQIDLNPKGQTNVIKFIEKSQQSEKIFNQKVVESDNNSTYKAINPNTRGSSIFLLENNNHLYKNTRNTPNKIQIKKEIKNINNPIINNKQLKNNIFQFRDSQRNNHLRRINTDKEDYYSNTNFPENSEIFCVENLNSKSKKTVSNHDHKINNYVENNHKDNVENIHNNLNKLDKDIKSVSAQKINNEFVASYNNDQQPKKWINKFATSQKFQRNLSNWEYILPTVCFKKENQQFFYFRKIYSYIREQLSIENILKGKILNQIFKKVIFNPDQIELLNNIPKIKFHVLEKLFHKDNDFNLLKILKNYNNTKQDEKTNKILEFYENYISQ